MLKAFKVIYNIATHQQRAWTLRKESSHSLEYEAC